jgi:hypothetical protein
VEELIGVEYPNERAHSEGMSEPYARLLNGFCIHLYFSKL